MDSWMGIGWLQILIAVAAVVVVAIVRKSRQPKFNYPPGPKPWPIVGNLLDLGPEPHRTVAEFTKKYGPLVFLRLGKLPAVITSDPEILNEMMKVQDNVFCSRPQTICGQYLTYGLHDFIMAPPGDHWRALRKICVMELLSNKRVESFAPQREEEAIEMLDAVLKTSKTGVEVDVKHKIEDFAMNILTDMILGKKYFGTHSADRDDNQEVMRLLMDSFQLFVIMNIGDYIPWLAPFDLQGYQKKMKWMHVALDVKLQAIVDEHKEAKKKGTNFNVTKTRTQDFVDVLLELPGEHGEEHMDDTTIKALILDLMWSGLDAPVNISEWAMAELVKNPDVQKKLQQELDSVVGKGRIVKDTDLVNLPYLKCVTKEVFRLHPAGPFGVPRTSIAHTKVMGYDIPEGTQVMVSNLELGRNAKVWSDPLVFRPERWETSNLALLSDPETRIFPFGVGRRSCAGANMGTSLVCLAVGNLVHSFDWVPPHGQKCEDIDMRLSMGGLLPMLTPLKAIATLRRPVPFTR